MDLTKLKKISSCFSSLVLLVVTQILNTAAQNDVFGTKVTIDPPSVIKGERVKFTCEFTLVNGKDLHLLYWETTNGDRLLTFNHKDSTTDIHNAYKTKITDSDYTYEEDPNSQKRIHTLHVTVDNCDRATYRCLILNQDDFTEGSDQKTLEIQANLPAPEPCMKVDGGDCIREGSIFKENSTKVTVSCTVTESSVEPDITLYMNNKALNISESIANLDGCLHNGVLQSEDITVKDSVFYCEANYGGTKKKSAEFGITDSKQDVSGTGSVTGADSANIGMILGIVFGVIILVVIVLAIIFVLKKRSKTERYQAGPTPAKV